MRSNYLKSASISVTVSVPPNATAREECESCCSSWGLSGSALVRDLGRDGGNARTGAEKRGRQYRHFSDVTARAGRMQYTLYSDVAIRAGSR